MGLIRRNWKWLVLGILAFLIVSGWGVSEYTKTPGFCNTCHIMDPYIEAWKDSSHGDVSCVKCHYRPGREFETKLAALNQVVATLTGQFDTKFHAEIDDAACLRSGCHDTRLLPGPIVFQRNIKFDHSHHLGEAVRGIKLRCTSCHSQIVQGSHMTVTEITCYLCHFKGQVSVETPQTQRFCLKCHGYPSESIKIDDAAFDHELVIKNGVECQRCHLDTVRGAGEVEGRACLQCHADPEQLEKITDPENVHLNHVTRHKVECFNCHADIEHSIYSAENEPITSCETCHTGPHQGPKLLYQGKGGYGVEEMPSKMFLAQVDCVGCHVHTELHGEKNVLEGVSKTFDEKACVNCHDGTATEVLAYWRADLKAEVERTKTVLTATERRAKTAPKQLTPELAEELEHARFNFNLVAYGLGVHNYDYSVALLDWTRETCKRVDAELK